MADTTAPSPPSPPKPVREKGYALADAGSFWVDLSNEETPELRWPLSVFVFDRMRRQDSQVGSVMSAVKTPIIRTRWRVDGRGCDPKVTEFVAQNLGLPLVGGDPEDDFKTKLRGRDRFSWDEHLRLALLHLDFGHMFFEQVYKPLSPDGLYRLGKLGPRMPRTISKVNVARDGGLISIQQFGTSTGGPPAELKVNRLVAYVNEKEGGNWLGRSLLRTGYKNWLLKDDGLRTWAIAVQRQGMGVPIYEAAEGETDLSAGQEIAGNARSGDNAGAALPHGAAFKLVGVEGTSIDPDKFVRYNDEAIARSALGHFLNLGTQVGGQVGSYNLGSVLANTFNDSLEAVAGYIADIASMHIVEDMVDVNFGSDVPAPLITFDQIGVRQSELERIRESVGLGSDADLIKFLRSIPSQEAP